MITWITVWFLVVNVNADSRRATTYTIPYGSEKLCKEKTKKYDGFLSETEAHCVSGQMPVYIPKEQ